MNHLTTTHRAVIGTEHGLRLLDGSATDLLADVRVTAVCVDDDNNVWILSDRRDLHRMSGDVVEHVASLPTAAGTCIGVHAGSVWVGGDKARLWSLSDGAFVAVESFDRAPTHAEWHTPWGGPPDVFSIATDGTDLYVSVHVGGILRSPDGVDWTATIDLHDDVHQVVVGPDGTLWSATGYRALARSTDRGDTWTYHSTGLHATYALAVAPTKDGAIVGVSSGHAAKDGALYTFDGDRFQRCEGLPDLRGAVGPRQLAAGGDRAVVALPDGDLYTSDDGGRHWTVALRGIGRVSEVAIARDRSL